MISAELHNSVYSVSRHIHAQVPISDDKINKKYLNYKTVTHLLISTIHKVCNINIFNKGFSPSNFLNF